MASKAAELRELPDEELYVRIESAKEELFNLRFQLATGQLDNSSRLKELRHDVARTLTVLRERHLEVELEAELARVDAETLERSRAAQEAGTVEGTPLGEAMPHEALVRRVLEQAPNEISHAGQQLADWTIFPDAIPHLDQRALDRSGHAVKQLEFEAAAINTELIRDRLRVGNTADVMRAERGRNDRLIFKKHARKLFKIRVALGFLKKDGRIRSVLT